MATDMIFTSESVTAGHPDKLCDQISDAAIDAFLRKDAGARAVVECAVATGVVFLAARYTASAAIDLPSLARSVIGEAGYLSGRFEAKSCSILTSLTELPDHQREPPAAIGDDDLDRFPARQHANSFGYACRETPELMPLPISLGHHLARAVDDARRKRMKWLSPDAKVQVSVEYKNSQPRRIHGVAVSASIEQGGPARRMVEETLREVVHNVLSDRGVADELRPQLHLTIGEDHEVGGPASHAGLTGRKNGIDTYGEMARQSGAALSGKDPSRIDRIGAYAARHAAKAVVAAGLAERCEVHLAYEIGQARPLSISVQSFGTGRIADEAMASRLTATMDFRPAAIERRFGLRARPVSAGDAGFYRRLAIYGHFGRTDLELPWEATGDSEALRQ
jgi:S-adenosylmethionine synthetase